MKKAQTIDLTFCGSKPNGYLQRETGLNSGPKRINPASVKSGICPRNNREQVALLSLGYAAYSIDKVTPGVISTYPGELYYPRGCRQYLSITNINSRGY